MTIGYGFTDPDLVKKGTITRQEADRELGKRVRKELVFIRSHIQGLTPRQEAAVVSFVYNVGHQAFLDSTFLKKLKASDMTAVKAEIQKWVYDKFGVYVHKVVPVKFFDKFGVPAEAQFTPKTNKPRRIYYGKRLLSSVAKKFSSN